jgi:hypothetical protein
VKIAPEGGALIYGTFLGGYGPERGYGIAVDGAGAAHVTGFTQATDFPTMNPLQRRLWGTRDAFVSKLSPTGATLIYSTYLGGGLDDGLIVLTRPSVTGGYLTSMAITVDLTGATYVTGPTRSDNFPMVNALQPMFAGDVCASDTADAFVVKITDETLASARTNESTGSRPESGRGGGGGGRMDALLVLLLAQLSISRAMRRRS